MKYIIQKGIRGFGDRLLHLMYCVKIALTTNRKVYVDWNDFYWNHSGENFYTYFELLNIGINKIDNLETLSVSPNFWKDKIHLPLNHDIFMNAVNSEKINVLSSIINKYPKEDVLVISNWKRNIYNNIEYFANIFRVKDTRIIDRVNELNKFYDLKNCTGIHLRGTDRKEGAKVGNANLLTKIKKTFKFGDKVVCFTDDLELYNDFKKNVPSATLITKIVFDKPMPYGTHTVLAKFLDNTKDEMNVDLLVDFFALALCKDTYTTFEKSTFFRSAKLLHPYVDMILGNGK